MNPITRRTRRIVRALAGTALVVVAALVIEFAAQTPWAAVLLVISLWGVVVLQQRRRRS